MLEVVARNPCFDSSKERLSRESNMKVTKGSLSTRYFDLYDEYIAAYEVATKKLDVKIQAFLDYQEAQDKVYRIRHELKKLEGKVNLYGRKVK